MTEIENSSSDYSAARSHSSSRLATHNNDVVVGFDHYLLAIKDQLCGESASLQVIPIVGMGGIGKTTLARNAYHDPLIREVFHIGGWVTVSQSYSVEEMLSTLLQSLKPFGANTERLEESHESKADEYAAEMSEQDYGSAEESESPEKVQKKSESEEGEQVYKTLKGRKYIVVMDDIWNTEVCDRLRMILPNDDNGSRIILTTRLLDVATYASGCSPHKMQLMHEDQSWNLLRQKVFRDGVCNPELEDICMAIARSCGGLPLAVVVIAGLLSTVEKSRSSWEEIAEKVNSTVAAKDGEFEKILSLSYAHLPLHLRQCFVYMGGFPEDYQIHVAKLTRLWMAEGFIEGVTASKSVEENAEECFEELIKRSLVLKGKKKHLGEIKSCSLHDLMRDFCKRKADEEKFPLYKYDVHVVGTYEDVRDLRVNEGSPVGYGLRLPNLRYLLLDSYSTPAELSYLENLQTLIIGANRGLVRLPSEIWRMKQLRHLISSFDQLPCPQVATSFPLENLLTLSEVRNLECSYRFVKMAPNIKKLKLVYLVSYEFAQAYHLHNIFCSHQHENLYDQAGDYDYRLENLKLLHRLENLSVRVHPGFRVKLNPVFPLSLKKLSLSGWILPSWEDMRIVGSLPNLQLLKLRGFYNQGKRWETTEGEFARLSVLLIEGSYLQEWITESEHFPRLKSLLLHSCWSLDEIPAGVVDIPTLELIEVKQGSTFLVESAKRIEEEQKEMGNDSLQVHYI